MMDQTEQNVRSKNGPPGAGAGCARVWPVFSATVRTSTGRGVGWAGFERKRPFAIGGVPAAARYLGVSESTLRRRLSKG